MPDTILNFLDRMTQDGVYLRDTGMLGAIEDSEFEYNEVNATRNMLKELPLNEVLKVIEDRNQKFIPHQVKIGSKIYNTRRIELLVCKFLICKVLIPSIVLSPTENYKKVPGKLAQHNLKILASTLWWVVCECFPCYKAGITLATDRKESGTLPEEMSSMTKGALRGLGKNAALKKLKFKKMLMKKESDREKAVQNLVTGSTRETGEQLAGAEGHMVTKRRGGRRMTAVSNKARTKLKTISGFQKRVEQREVSRRGSGVAVLLFYLP